MRKMSFVQWIAVAVAILVVGAFFFYGDFVNLFVPQASQPASQVISNETQTGDQAALDQQNQQNQMQNDMGSSTPAGAPATGGLQMKDTVVGTGAVAEPGDTITVNYTGRFTNGQVFDSSIPRGQPFVFVLGAGQVIPGWDQGVVGMKVGGQRTLTVPPELGYGPNDYGAIPGNSTLIFDIQLLDVKKPS
jgi:FKBP-type peptidyl-prolyl cis-trans isomerase